MYVDTKHLSESKNAEEVQQKWIRISTFFPKLVYNLKKYVLAK